MEKRQNQPVSGNTIKGGGAGRHKISPIRGPPRPGFHKIKKYHERPGTKNAWNNVTAQVDRLPAKQPGGSAKVVVADRQLDY